MTSSRFLGDLFASEAPRLRRLLRRFGPNVSPEDIVQESFARLCAVDQSTIHSPRAFLTRTARNLAIDGVRRSGIAPITAVPDLDLVASAAQAPGPEEDEGESEEALLARLDDALATLPTHLREAITLYMIDSVPQGEIARRLGVTERTVRRYVAEALARCHAVLRANAEQK
jgi:RNA polymerase sigma-70 factor (ECF subfamily)